MQVFNDARDFARVYQRETQQSPARAIAQLRLEAARRMLEETSHSIQQIARLAGFGDDEGLRRTFVKAHGVAPLDYRGRFGRLQAKPAPSVGGFEPRRSRGARLSVSRPPSHLIEAPPSMPHLSR
jgi:AraC-like DNA-binding protein